MVEIAKIQMLINKLVRNGEKYKVAQVAIEDRQVRDAILTLLSAPEAQREEIASFLHQLLVQWRVFGYVAGQLHGYAFAKGLMKIKKKAPGIGKQERIVIKKIEQVLTKNRRATDYQVAVALDNASIPLLELKTVPKDVRLWQYVVKEPFYKNRVSRVREQFDRAQRVKTWRKMIKELNISDREAFDLLDIDSVF